MFRSSRLPGGCETQSSARLPPIGDIRASHQFRPIADIPNCSANLLSYMFEGERENSGFGVPSVKSTPVTFTQVGTQVCIRWGDEAPLFTLGDHDIVIEAMRDYTLQTGAADRLLAAATNRGR